MAKQYSISAAKAARLLNGGKALDEQQVAGFEEKLGVKFPGALREMYLACGGFDIGAKSRVFAPSYISLLDGEDKAFLIGTSGDRLACIFGRDIADADPDVYLGTLSGRSLDFSKNQKLSEFLDWVIFEAVTEIKGEVIGVDDKGEISELADKMQLDLKKLSDGRSGSCVISLDDETGELVFTNTDADANVAVMVVVGTGQDG